MQNYYSQYLTAQESSKESLVKESLTLPSSVSLTTHHTTQSTTTTDSNIDLNTVIQASQSLSKEIDISKLSEALMRLMIVSAGATRAVLIRFNNNEPVIYSEITTNTPYQPINTTIPIAERSKDICLKRRQVCNPYKISNIVKRRRK